MATTKKTTTKKVTTKKAKKVEEPKHIGLVRDDSWLEPFEQAIRGRHDHALWKIAQLTRNGKKTLSDFASGHLYFGLHKLAKGWVFREWAPNATEIYLVGDFNNWQESDKYKCKRIEPGAVVWYRTSRRRFSLHRCGILRSLMSGRKRPSSPTSHRC